MRPEMTEEDRASVRLVRLSGFERHLLRSVIREYLARFPVMAGSPLVRDLLEKLK